MRLTTLLRRLLGVTQMYVKQVEMAADGPLTVSVEPAWRRSRCGTWGSGRRGMTGSRCASGGICHGAGCRRGCGMRRGGCRAGVAAG